MAEHALPLPLLLAQLLIAPPKADSAEYRLWLERTLRSVQHLRERLRGELIAENDPQVGDWICVHQRNGKYHHGIVVGDGRVVHATVKRDVIETSMATFRKGQTLRLVHRADGFDVLKAVFYARGEVGKRYSLFKRNCEHLCSAAHFGVAVSQQLQIVLSIAVAAAGIRFQWYRATHGGFGREPSP